MELDRGLRKKDQIFYLKNASTRIQEVAGSSVNPETIKSTKYTSNEKAIENISAIQTVNGKWRRCLWLWATQSRFAGSARGLRETPELYFGFPHKASCPVPYRFVVFVHALQCLIDTSESCNFLFLSKFTHSGSYLHCHCVYHVFA